MLLISLEGSSFWSWFDWTGVCPSLKQLIETGCLSRNLARTPGPGAYGIPDEQFQRYSDRVKHASIQGILARQSRDDRCVEAKPYLVVLSHPAATWDRAFATPGTSLAPAHYAESAERPLIRKNVGKRGPFDVHTGSRFKPVKVRAEL